MKHPFITAPMLWLSLVLFTVLAIAFILPVLPNDYWWYLRIGQETLTAGAVPRGEMLSYTRAGSPVAYL